MNHNLQKTEWCNLNTISINQFGGGTVDDAELDRKLQDLFDQIEMQSGGGRHTAKKSSKKKSSTKQVGGGKKSSKKASKKQDGGKKKKDSKKTSKKREPQPYMIVQKRVVPKILEVEGLERKDYFKGVSLLKQYMKKATGKEYKGKNEPYTWEEGLLAVEKYLKTLKK